jgi:hypothetical protein
LVFETKDIGVATFGLAEKEHQLALKLSPNSGGAHASYAIFLVYVGRFDEAKSQINFTIELDPFSPDCRTQLAFAAYYAGQYDLAIEESGNTGNDHGLGTAYAMKKIVPGGHHHISKARQPLGTATGCCLKTCLGLWPRWEKAGGTEVAW